MAMIVRGFVEPIARELPMEYALELNRSSNCRWKEPWADARGEDTNNVSVTEVPNVAGAIETIESHLHPKPSFDLADHPCPPAARRCGGSRPHPRRRRARRAHRLTAGHGRPGRANRVRRDRGRAALQGDVVLRHTGLGAVLRERRDRRQRRRQPDRGLAAGLGRRRAARRRAHRPRGPRRHATARQRQLRRQRRPAAHQRVLRGPRRARRAVRPLLRRRRPAHRAPDVRRPQRARHLQQRRLPRRAAGQGRALGVDRRRADPQGRREHRDLRDQQEPGAHRGGARRLGAEPRDRDRRDRRRRPLLDHRPVRRRAAVLPDQPRHRPRRGQAPRRDGLLRRHHPPHRRPRRRGAPDRRGRARARRSPSVHAKHRVQEAE
jgi:hypothetical protein